jgi:DNA-directed RNA polymerase subunit H
MVILKEESSKESDETQELNVLDHIYVPKHEIVNSAEAERIVANFNAKPEQFPYILISDPVVKLIKAKPGDLIKITRKSETAGETVYYRFVVEG